MTAWSVASATIGAALEEHRRRMRVGRPGGSACDLVRARLRQSGLLCLLLAVLLCGAARADDDPSTIRLTVGPFRQIICTYPEQVDGPVVVCWLARENRLPQDVLDRIPKTDYELVTEQTRRWVENDGVTMGRGGEFKPTGAPHWEVSERHYVVLDVVSYTEGDQLLFCSHVRFELGPAGSTALYSPGWSGR